jgi:hypothetical protein
MTGGKNRRIPIGDVSPAVLKANYGIHPRWAAGLGVSRVVA